MRPTPAEHEAKFLANFLSVVGGWPAATHRSTRSPCSMVGGGPHRTADKVRLHSSTALGNSTPTYIGNIGVHFVFFYNFNSTLIYWFGPFHYNSTLIYNRVLGNITDGAHFVFPYNFHSTLIYRSVFGNIGAFVPRVRGALGGDYITRGGRSGVLGVRFNHEDRRHVRGVQDHGVYTMFP